MAHHVGVGVKVRDKENIDRALRRFKRAVNRSRVLRMYRQNMAYTKPSEERRLAKEKLPADGSDVCGMLIGPARRSSIPPAGCR